ncbi:MAG TPA: type II toxin-antitoxin system ParD family antitoxin [Pirellulaceae bacterium]|nr:type II toxin-antitoxin system ParD family antitoxin [Planctomycetaceae bacterium]HRX81234.1 type II toxin-antitoxin system ParD family antitoxin [Pirellulaceae bacterium]
MSDSASISIPSDLEQFVNDQVASGAYTNAEHVVREALERMRERDKSRETRIEELRQQIQIGIDQADRGECTPLDIETIKQKARSAWAQQQASQ